MPKNIANVAIFGVSASPEVFKLLIDKIKENNQLTASINYKDKLGNTPLITAILKHAPKENIKLLLTNGANPNIKNNEGKTAFDICIEEKRGGRKSAGRKGPSESATSVPLGTIKIGNDKNFWITKKHLQTQRWVKLSSSYLIHDNGGRPLLVHLDKHTAKIYKCPKEPAQTKLIKTYHFKKAFVPKPTGKALTDDFTPAQAKNFIGNTILLQLTQDRLAFIGSDAHKNLIYEFSINDKPVKFFSSVGHSDVPYPVLLGSENVYFMLDQTYVPRSQFPSRMNDNDWAGAYNLYYGRRRQKRKGNRMVMEITDALANFAEPMKKVKKVHKRIFC